MSTKDTNWFKHDYDPTGDPKMQAMLNDYGGLGYGIYWRIAEMLHIDRCNKLPLKKYIYTAIVKQMQANASNGTPSVFHVNLSLSDIENFITHCITEYELFQSDGTHFWSERVIRNIDNKKKISEIRSKAASKN